MTEIQIECFLAIANHLNFARAASELNISQPAVTHQIQALEAELGVKLFRRSTRTVFLTPEGEYFLDDAKSMQQIILRAKSRFSKDGVINYESLTIGCSSPYQVRLMSNTLKNLRMEYSDFHPQFRYITQSQIPPKIDDGILDVALGTKLKLNSQSKVKYKELTVVSLRCVCPKDHPFSRLDNISLEDLKESKLIIYTPISASPEIALTQRNLVRNKNITDTYLCEYSEDAILLVEAGYGVTILPDIFIPNWADVNTIPIRDAKKLSFGLYYKAHFTNDILRRFVNLMNDEMGQLELLK